VRPHHEPVLLVDVLRFWRNGPGVYLDATLGDGGHAEALLDAEPGARLLGCDRDPRALERAHARLARFGDRVMLVHARFSELPEVLRARGVDGLRGALADLGVSSPQIDDPSRGMSFRVEGPLDLRMDPERGAPASVRLAQVDEETLARILVEEGEVPRARGMARAILRARDRGMLATTGDLARVVAAQFGGRPHPRRLAQVFQALRRWINEEAEELRSLIAFLPQALEEGGVWVSIAYHSGEDRMVKQAIRPAPPAGERGLPIAPAPCPWEALSRRAIKPTQDEVERNPRARSARLRAARRRSG
jgi:16S rRNA (cytosine1402-N4)-methyltransferase